MIPSNRNFPGENAYKQKIKIQLTNDNRCIIQSEMDTPNKSQNNTINKSEPSINLMDYNDNDLMSLSKSINSISNIQKPINNNNNIENNTNKKINNNNDNNFDEDGNSNLLISFSNISELTKLNNNDNSFFYGLH